MAKTQKAKEKAAPEPVETPEPVEPEETPEERNARAQALVEEINQAADQFYRKRRMYPNTLELSPAQAVLIGARDGSTYIASFCTLTVRCRKEDGVQVYLILR